MFREMRRSKQALSRQECLDILKEQPRGVLSVLGDDGYPYGIPMDHWYCEEDGKLYFHGSRVGHKADALRACGKVSYCVHDEGSRNEGEWVLNFRSVVVFGRIRFVEDAEQTRRVCENLCRKFTDDRDYFEQEFAAAGQAVLCFELTPEHITGKRVRES